MSRMLPWQLKTCNKVGYKTVLVFNVHIEIGNLRVQYNPKTMKLQRNKINFLLEEIKVKY